MNPKKQSSKNVNVATKKSKAATKKKSKNQKYAKKFTSSAQIGVKAPNFDLHMTRAGEVPY